MRQLLALAAGLIFGIGLIAGGMTDPAKVKGFLDLAGAWDPSLALVVGGGIAIGLVAFALARKQKVSWSGDPIDLPTNNRIDARLLIGGAEVVQSYRQQSAPVQQGRLGAPSDDVGVFVAKVLGETEDVWTVVLPQQAGRDYERPRLVLFSGATQSACGFAQAATGPFYCPPDKRIYLDTSFFDEMKRRLGGGGEFAYAYVIAQRVARARRLLETTDLPIARVAIDAGFADQAHLTRMLRRHLGVTPRNIRLQRFG